MRKKCTHCHTTLRKSPRAPDRKLESAYLPPLLVEFRHSTSSSNRDRKCTHFQNDVSEVYFLKSRQQLPSHLLNKLHLGNLALLVFFFVLDLLENKSSNNNVHHITNKEKQTAS